MKQKTTEFLFDLLGYPTTHTVHVLGMNLNQQGENVGSYGQY